MSSLSFLSFCYPTSSNTAPFVCNFFCFKLSVLSQIICTSGYDTQRIIYSKNKLSALLTNIEFFLLLRTGINKRKFENFILMCKPFPHCYLCNCTTDFFFNFLYCWYLVCSLRIRCSLQPKRKGHRLTA